jgi:protein-disulfide isomerase
MHRIRMIWTALAFSVLFSTLLLGLPAPGRTQTDPPPLTKEAVEQIIRQYLLDHPEVVADSIRLLQERQRTEERRRAGAAIAGAQEELLRDPATPVGGNPRGDVTVVEFFDYQCGYCKRVAPVLKQLIAEDPKVRVAYKEFPILSPESVLAARAALAANRQGKYERFHELLMEAAGPLTLERILAVAGEATLDVEALKGEMSAPAVQAALDKTQALAQSLGLRGTPAFIVGTEFVPGAVDLPTLKALVAKARGLAR